MTASAVPTRGQLRDHLVRTRISGDVATPRENNLNNFSRLAARDPHYLFGLEPTGSWTAEEVFDLMVARVGIDPDPARRQGTDTIDPDRTIDALDAMAARLATAAQRRERVLLATGHPAGMYAVHAAAALALASAGCPLLTPAPGAAYRTARGEHREVRHLGGVAMVSNRGGLNHTHSPEPMHLMLAALARDGEPPPDLVLADHGFAGAAGQAGIDAMGFADCNDPGLFVGEAEGRLLVSVPLDDNVLPNLYAPVSAYLLRDVG